LLRRNVDVVHLLAALQNEVAGLAAVDQLGGNAFALIERGVGLGDHVAVLLPRGEIEAVRVEGDLAALELRVDGFDFVALDNLADLELAFAGVDDQHVVDDAPALDLAIGRLDEAELVDARIAGKRADQSDV